MPFALSTTLLLFVDSLLLLWLPVRFFVLSLPLLDLLDFFLTTLLLPLTLSRPLLLLGTPPVRGTFMLQPATHGDEVLELSCALRGLTITVRGPSAQTVDFVRFVTDDYNPSAAGPSSTISEQSFDLVSELPPSPRAAISSSPGVGSSFSFEAREQLQFASRLASISGIERVKRAWLAGQWAGAVAAVRSRSPNRSTQLDLICDLIQYQVMMSLDCIMMDNHNAAKDCAALLAVMLEHMVLDNGRLEVASLLSLEEDIPMSVFANRLHKQGEKLCAFGRPKVGHLGLWKWM